LGSSDNIDEIARELSTKAGAQIEGRRCDVADWGQVVSSFATFGQVDVYVNNAGIERHTPMDGDDRQRCLDIERTASINFSGALFTARAVAPHMVNRSRMIFTASIWSRIGVADFSAYCASKHATLGMMRCMARELGPRGIRVNAVCPGWVRTSASLASLEKIARQQGKSTEKQLDEITSTQCLGGLLEPEELTSAYLFLASDGARDITGQTITVDRGELCI
jgi:3-hydroxybutyrate dehydrogenase